MGLQKLPANDWNFPDVFGVQPVAPDRVLDNKLGLVVIRKNRHIFTKKISSLELFNYSPISAASHRASSDNIDESLIEVFDWLTNHVEFKGNQVLRNAGLHTGGQRFTKQPGVEQKFLSAEQLAQRFE